VNSQFQCPSPLAHFAQVQFLLDMHAPKFVVNNDGEMPLDMAYRMDLEQIILILGRDVSTRLIQIVWEAIKANDLEKIKEVNSQCQEREAVSDLPMKCSVTSLYASAGMGRRGFQVQEDLFKDMPYHQLLNLAALWAATRFKLDLLDFLLDQKALNFQLVTLRESLIKYLILCRYQNSDGTFLLYQLCRGQPGVDEERYKATLMKCLRNGAYLNVRNIEENTCLHIAALHANAIAVDFLLDNGCFPNSINK
jgi:ankyrin repeat protein